VPFGEGLNGGEVFYQQKDNSDPFKNEDDGYLMTSVHDWRTDKSHLMVWDAKSLEVVCKADLDERVPNGFHTFFVHESD